MQDLKKEQQPQVQPEALSLLELASPPEERTAKQQRHDELFTVRMQEVESDINAAATQQISDWRSERAAFDEARAAATEQERLAKVAKAELEAAQLAERRVRLKLRGRFAAARISRVVAAPPEPPLARELPAGCRLYEGAIPDWEAADALDQLGQYFSKDKRVKTITAGQRGNKRRQLKMQAEELSLFQSFKDVLADAGELKGRDLGEFNAIRSEDSCIKQDRHWDFDPDLVRYIRRPRRKPCSAILALQPGSRLYVYDTLLKHDVTVPIPPGAILVFDGDVAHAGASYATPNTRVHVYLDVEGVRREKDVTWFD
jgi:hypothetical protein